MRLNPTYLSVAIGLLMLTSASTVHAATPTRPNIVMVFIDDMGWEDFSCFGNQEAKTPHIDRLAAEGVRFSQFYVNSPICSSSRCALITGQYPQRWRITSFLNNREDNERRGMANWLDPDAPSLPRMLHQHGYATGHFGKWHLGGQRDVDDAPPISAYGFDESLTNFEGMGAKLLPLTMKPGDKKPGRIWEGAERLGEPITWMQRSKITGGFVDAAISFIDRAEQEDKPFYVNLWPDDVHSPFWPPVGKWADDKRGLYLSVLEEMDRQLGALFDHIRDSPSLRENTLILVCSDNGPEPGAGSAGPFRGTKGGIYEGGIRSPLIVWGPSLITEDKRGFHNETSVLAAIDLTPSLLELAGAESPREVKFDGEEVSKTLVGGDASRKSLLFWRRPPSGKGHARADSQNATDLAVRDGDWKLLCSYTGTHPQLYNLAADRSEFYDLSASNPAIVKRLTAAVLQWHKALPPDNGPTLGVRSPARSRPDRTAGG